MTQFKTFEFQAIEVLVPSNNTSGQYNFADQRQLTDSPGRTIVIEGIEVYSQNTTNNISPVTGSSIPDTDIIKSSFLTIKQGGNLTLQNIPLAALLAVSNIGSAYGNNGIISLKLLRNLRNITWSQSYIQYRGDSGSAPAAGTVFPFGIYYSVLEDLPNLTLNV